MKKPIALLLTLMICLSLCACGGDSETSKTDEVSSKAKDESLASSESFNYSNFMSDVANNSLQAKEKYVGSSYSFSGYVGEINEEFCVLRPLNDPKKSTKLFFVRAYLPYDVLKTFNKGEFVTIVGTIEEIVNDSCIAVRHCHYVDNIFTYEAIIISPVYSSSSDTEPNYYTAMIKSIIDFSAYPYCEIYFENEPGIELKGDDVITVSGTLKSLTDDSTNIRYVGTMEEGKRVSLVMENANINS